MTRTSIIVTALVITLGIYDLYVVGVCKNIDCSVSRFMQNTSIDAPFVSFTVGYICGHIFGYMKPKRTGI
jgi:hypothetical protein